MKKNFYINIVLLLLINLLIKPIYLFGIDRKIQILVGEQAYGYYVELLTFTLLFQVLNDLGIYNYSLRYFSQKKEEAHELLAHLFGVKVVFSIIYLIFVAVIALLTHRFEDALILLLHLAINQVMITFIQFFRSLIAGHGYYRTDTLVSSLDKLLMILMGAMYIYYGNLSSSVSINGFVWIQSISLAITLLVAAFIFILVIKGQVRFDFDLSRVRVILSACIPFILIYFFNTCYSKQDILLIGQLLEDGATENGIYASSIRIFDACNMLALSFGTLFLGLFSSAYPDKNKLTVIVSEVSIILIIISVGIGCVGFYHSDWFNEVLYHKNIPKWNANLKLVFLSFIPSCLTYIFGGLMQAIHKEKRLALIYFLMMVMNAILNYLLIPRFHSYGACITLLTTQIVVLILMCFNSRSELDFRKLKKLGIRAISFGFLCFGAIFLFKTNIDMAPIWSIVISSLIVLTMAILFKLVSVNELVSMIKNKTATK